MGIRPLANMNDAFLTWLGDLFQNVLLCFPLFLQQSTMMEEVGGILMSWLDPLVLVRPRLDRNQD